MTILLESISLSNFKGVRDLTLLFNGRDATISGTNGAGKTTIVDAFLWLLFNKDSEDRGQFEVKTLDDKNRPIHNLLHEVEAILSIDGKRVTLRKALKEIWTKKRGNAQQEFDGHTTDYWINEEPTKLKDYQSYIANLVDADNFKLITNPLFFSTKLHWEKRRETLLRICGEITPDAIIAAGGEALSGLSELIGERTVEATRKVVFDKRKKANDELVMIPAQIDAVSKTLPELLDDYTGVQSELDDCRAKIKELDEQTQTASKALEPIREKGRELAKLEGEQSALLAKLERDAAFAQEDTLRREKQAVTDLDNAKMKMETTHSRLMQLKERREEMEATINKHREDYKSEYETVFKAPLEDELICESCGQDLPAEKRTQLVNDARSRFDAKRNSLLEEITIKGTKAKEEAESLDAEIVEAEKQLQEATDERDKKSSIVEINKVSAENITPPEKADHTTNADYIELGAKIEALRAELETPPDDDTGTITTQRTEVNERIDELIKVLSERDASETSKKVIADYTKRERELSDLIVEYDGQLFMLETYVRLEAELLEGNINAKFKTLSFKLFKEQINGGLTPTCEALIGGVPFSEANTAGQFNAGMEIIDALCEEYGVNAPVFVDRCESINTLTPIKSQVIRMVVVNKEEMAISEGKPNVKTVRAARSDISIKVEEKEKEIA